MHSSCCGEECYLIYFLIFVILRHRERIWKVKFEMKKEVWNMNFYARDVSKLYEIKTNEEVNKEAISHACISFIFFGAISRHKHS